MQKPKLYGVSTGPGDPEWMTLKAVRCIREAECIAVPRTAGTHTMALDIVLGAMGSDVLNDKRIVYLDYTMSKSFQDREADHKRCIETILSCLREGLETAMLTIGDAGLYSTFGDIRKAVLEEGYEVETIPGVNSFSAAAALLNRMLTVPNQPLTIIPEQFDGVEGALRTPGTKVIMKPGKDSAKWKEQLKRAGLLESASAVCDCGLPGEKIYHNASDVPEQNGYFTLIIAKKDDK